MPHKKQKKDMKEIQDTKDIWSFFKKTDTADSSSSTTSESTQTGGAADSKMATHSQMRLKKENDGKSKDGHSHHFTVKFSPKDLEEYTVDCDEPRTVLEVIKSSEHKDIMEKWSDENIIIQLGKEDKKFAVATHFPCSCIDDDECLILLHKHKMVEKPQGQHNNIIHTRYNYSVFYIDTIGGENSETKQLFRHNAFTHFKFLCVYGEKGTTVEEALKRDGRFIDDLGDFILSDNKTKSITRREREVDKLDQKEYKIRLPLNKRANDKKKQQESSRASNNLQCKSETTAVVDVAHQKGISVIAAAKKRGESVNTVQVYDLLRKQCPGLKELMESRFPGDSYQKTLNLKKENFGKIQQSFSEVHRVRKLIKLGESVCKVIVQDVREGTGFVLFDNFILTNAHLFEECVEGQQLKEGVNVFVLFNYEDPDLHTKFYYFQLAHQNILYSYDELDYAILELNPEGHKPNDTTQKKFNVPPGLLNKFGPMPLNGEACIIGHPGGGVKKMDPTCIIEKEKREQAVNEHLHQFKGSAFIVHIINSIKEQGIEKIMMGGNRADKVGTYNTSMYHGSSGSPVFDAHGRVVGLHSGGFPYGFPKESVIEFAQPVFTLFEHFVKTLMSNRDEMLLRRVKQVAKGNGNLKKVLESVCEPFSSDEVQPVNIEPMDTD